ncbi:putative holin [Rhodoferax aquaticus]|uniref:Uncharacterized protein n=1 Tax=Rhodoferax aquaticus TaxID=2527691 RepID=A0A515ETD0_9BURK|nr:putative holin [Rhodoferax aquaticus]QDL55911.1 hypothetical protein EXZ61_17980 [Rhodoferax aquaticus]
MFTLPRMLLCLVLTLALIGLSMLLQAYMPGTLVAVTAYKAHLMSLGGWGGYWLDRALFPYDRPHTYLLEAGTAATCEVEQPELIEGVFVGAGNFGASMMRRAIVVAACLICVGLGA